MKDNYGEFLAKRVLQLMEHRNEYKASVAKGCGISRQQLDTLLAGSGNPTLQSLAQIAEYFELSLSQLLAPELHVDSQVRVPKETTLEESLANVASNVEKLTQKVGAIPADVLDMLAKEASEGNDLLFDGLRIMIKRMNSKEDFDFEATLVNPQKTSR